MSWGDHHLDVVPDGKFYEKRWAGEFDKQLLAMLYRKADWTSVIEPFLRKETRCSIFPSYLCRFKSDHDLIELYGRIVTDDSYVNIAVSFGCSEDVVKGLCLFPRFNCDLLYYFNWRDRCTLDEVEYNEHDFPDKKAWKSRCMEVLDPCCLAIIQTQK